MTTAAAYAHIASSTTVISNSGTVVTTGAAVVTGTVDGVITSFTTYCPLSTEGASGYSSTSGHFHVSATVLPVTVVNTAATNASSTLDSVAITVATASVDVAPSTSATSVPVLNAPESSSSATSLILDVKAPTDTPVTGLLATGSASFTPLVSSGSTTLALAAVSDTASSSNANYNGTSSVELKNSAAGIIISYSSFACIFISIFVSLV